MSQSKEIFSWDHLWFILMGCIVFSNLSSIITMQIMHFPFSFNEMLLAPFVLLLWNKFKLFTLGGKLPLIIIVVVTLILIALAWGYFPLYPIISNARAWFYLFIGYFAFKNRNEITSDDLLFTSLGMLIGWALSALYNIFFVMSNLTTMELNEKSVEATGVMMCIPIYFAMAFTKKSKLWLLLGLALILFICLFGGQRRIMVVSAVSVLVAFIFSLRRNKSAITRYVIIGGVVVTVFIALLPLAEAYIMDLSPMLHHRIFVRTEVLFTGGMEETGDDIRSNNIKLFFENILEYSVPRGFVSLRTDIDKGTGIFNDLPFLMLSWIYSWPLVLYFISTFLIKMRANYKLYVAHGQDESIIAATCLVVMFVLLFLEGTYLTYAESAVFTGAMLGLSSRFAKRRHLLVK